MLVIDGTIDTSLAGNTRLRSLSLYSLKAESRGKGPCCSKASEENDAPVLQTINSYVFLTI